jgi:N-acetylornithine carbamoyltransferase
MKHFTHLKDFSSREFLALADEALAFKRGLRPGAPLSGKSLGFFFMNPSLRTQVSCEAAAAALGAHPITLNLAAGQGVWKMEAGEGVVMDGAASEHWKEAVPVLSRYCAALGLRSFPEGASWDEDRLEPHLTAFLKHATVPVVNLESATGHPCQALADLATIKERLNPRGRNFLLTWAPHVKALPMAVPLSAVEMAAMAGMNVTIARPEGYDLPAEDMERVRARCAENGARLSVTDRVPEAFDGQHVVYAKSWGSLAAYGQVPSAEPAFRARWMVTAEKMRRTEKALFMHCLPVRRNLVVEDAVLDGPWSVVIDEAENRLHAAKAVLSWLLTPKPSPILEEAVS